MYKNLSILVFFFLLISAGVQAREDSIKSQLPKDTVSRLHDKAVVSTEVAPQVADSIKLKTFKSDPARVTWMGAIIPGYGQILNKKYWKLPLVYGGFLGCAYAISWNSTTYNSYRNAYLDIYKYNRADDAYKRNIDKNPANVSFYQILQKGYTVQTYGGYTSLENALKSKQESFRRYRDLSIIATIIYYAVTIVDAYVDAQLYDFDISPDLSMRLQPAMIKRDFSTTNTFALQCSFNLK